MQRLFLTTTITLTITVMIFAMAALTGPYSDHGQPPFMHESIDEHSSRTSVTASEEAAAIPVNYEIPRHVIASGGETFSTGGNFSLGGTIGQHDAGVMSGGEGGNEYILAGGFWAGGAAHGEPDCPVIADLNCDGVVDELDMYILLSEWGECPESGDCPADLNGDGFVDGLDLLILLSNWG